MGKGKSKAQSHPVGGQTQGDLGRFVTRSSAAYMQNGKYKMAPVPTSLAHSEPAPIMQVQSRSRSASLAELEPSLHSPHSLSQASLCSGDGWDMESQVRSMHTYM